MTVRTTLIPGVNSSPEQIRAMSEALLSVGINAIHLLSYNRLWEGKLARLDTQQHARQRWAEELDLSRVRALYADHGVTATGETEPGPGP